MAAVVVGLAVGLILLIAAESNAIRGAIAAAMCLLLTTVDIPTLKRLLLGTVLLEIPIQVDIYINHDEAIAASGALSGFNVSLTTLCLVGLYGLMAAELLAKTAPFSRQARRSMIPSLFYFGCVLLSVAAATDALMAMYEIVILGQALLLFIYVIHFVKSDGDVVFIVAMIVLGLLLESLIVLGTAALGRSVTVGPLHAGFFGTRFYGTFGSPVVLGSYLAITLPSALALLMTPTRAVLRLLGATAFSFGSIVLALTFTRGAWLGFSAAATVVVLYAWRKGWVSVAVPVVATIVAVVLMALLWTQIADRVSDYDNASAQARFPLMDLAFRMIRDHPIAGLGANNFSSAMNQYLTVEFSRDWIYTVHNKYLLVWSETGLGGLIGFLWFLGAALRRGWLTVIANDRLKSPLALGLMAGIGANLIHMTVDVFHARPQTQMLWLTGGVLVALWLVGRSERPMHRAELTETGRT